MNTKRLFYFFECYFHQDWRDDYTSSFDALNDFCLSEPTLKQELRQSFLELAEKGDDLSANFIHEFGGNFKTESEALTGIEWLKKAISQMEKIE